jgi:DNA-directed RNA polymerase specialized sigma24 family protein
LAERRVDLKGPSEMERNRGHDRFRSLDLKLASSDAVEADLPCRWRRSTEHLTDPPKSPSDCPEFGRIVEAVRGAEAGEAAGRNELFLLLLRFQGRLMASIGYYRDVSWDLAYDAALDMNVGAVETAVKKEFLLPPESCWLWRFLYRRASRQLWLNRRQSKDTSERRRGKAARQENTASPHLPRIMYGSEALLGVVAKGHRDPMEHAFAKEAFSRVCEVAARHLPRPQRTIFFARLEKLPFDEIARMAGTTPGAARVRYLKAARELRMLEGEAA